VKGVQGHVRFVYFERIERTHKQVWEVADHFAVNPTFYFAVILPDGIGTYH
jgi:hypothetical protein